MIPFLYILTFDNLSSILWLLRRFSMCHPSSLIMIDFGIFLCLGFIDILDSVSL